MKERKIFHHLFCFLITSSLSSLSAQETDFLQDSSFFAQQASVYQEWLQSVGLGRALKVDGIKVRKQSVTIRLGFKYATEDSASTAWRQLKSEFEENSLFTLEERLFYKMIHVMEIPAINVEIIVSDNFNPAKIPCLYGRIYHKNGQVQSTVSPCRSQSNSIIIGYSELKNKMAHATTNLKDKDSIGVRNRNKIYAIIEQKAQKHFVGDNVSFVAKKDSLLHLKVINVKRQVIKRSAIDVVDFLDYHELLTIIIKYKPIRDGIRLDCFVDGKYGGGFYPTRSERFKEMEPKYTADLKEYIEVFSNTIGIWLKEGL